MDETLIAKYPGLERSHFWWVTRRSFVKSIYEEYAANGGVGTVLDVGCGSGVTASMLTELGAEVTGVDLDVHRNVGAQPDGSRLVRADYLEIRPDLGTFDFVVALDSVEHFEDERAVLDALFQSTCSGGRALVTVPAFQWLWSSHDVDSHHYRRYTRSSLRDALTSAGFTVDRVGYLFLALIGPKSVTALLERGLARSLPSGTGVTDSLNDAARRYFKVETRLALAFRNFLPFGTSVAALATRPAL